MPTLDPIAILKEVLATELIQWGTVFVVVIQVLKRSLPMIDTTKPLPASLAWGLFALNYVIGYALAFQYNAMRMEGGTFPTLGDNVWFLGAVVATWMELVYWAADYGFGEWKKIQVKTGGGQ